MNYLKTVENNRLYPNNNIFYKFKSNNINSNFKQQSNSVSNKADAHKINIPALIGSIIGTLIPMIITKKIQNKGLLNINYEFKEMIFVGTGAILGGLIGGIIKDKKEKKWEKVKEANFQWITNLLLPTFFVDQFLKYANKAFPKQNNKIAKVIAVIAGVGSGMKIGEIVTNKINSFIDKGQSQKRKLKARDAILHVDDLPVGLTLSKVSYIDKLLPFCFIYSGYQTGKGNHND
ncbi:MAG: hypothetical protein WC197_07495 [Candidatus Gastranaerophilaceae bacterium]|jgi:hypothetical protein